MTAQIDWKAPAEYIADGAGTGAFIDKIEAGEARLIAATEADIAAAARLNDMKFLDPSHRMNVRGDVQEIFAAVNDDGREALDADTPAHFMAQRAGNLGRELNPKDRKSTRLNSSPYIPPRIPSSAC